MASPESSAWMPHESLFVRRLPMFIGEPDLMIAHAFWPPEEINDDAHLRMQGTPATTHPGDTDAHPR